MPAHKAFAYLLFLIGSLVAYQMVFGLNYSYVTSTAAIKTMNGYVESQKFDSGRMSAYEIGDPAAVFWALTILFITVICASGFYIRRSAIAMTAAAFLFLLSILGAWSFGMMTMPLALISMIGAIVMQVSKSRQKWKDMREEYISEIRL